ncbi:MAG: hypothetical protein BLM47_10870 [Candidatus Reconcilbacillus cellulovorans]|uniref:Fluoride-specific ion channel FluC n=1 Tax=Candidatus Reconcilbacillus cellulovorans TaxID=1906605 RepID=A0A2A6DYG4_9BACL|nr:MAG: hypothetical protein BLM47_10870 [Candidatus Reconcilbacillus cellulovorans]
MCHVAVGLAGAAGSLLRYALDAWIVVDRFSGFPWGTLAANAAGCFALGWLSVRFGEDDRLPVWVKIAATTGFLGSLTTFSALALETVELARQDGAPAAAGYAALSLILGLAMMFAGRKTATVVGALRPSGEEAA